METKRNEVLKSPNLVEIVDDDGNQRPSVDLTEYRFVKRTSNQPPKRPRDLFVSSQSDMLVLVKKARRILDNPNTPELVVHGLGAALSRAVDLALLLERECRGALHLEVETHSVEQRDDYLPLDHTLGGPLTQLRLCSAIRITFRKDAKHTTRKPGQEKEEEEVLLAGA